MSLVPNRAIEGAAGNQGYNIQRSLRFRSSASAYLSRTNSNNPTNATKGTLSVWVKLGSLNTGTSQYIVETGTGTSNNSYFTLFFDTNNNINSGQYSETPFTNTSIVFRDPSAWYHVFIAYDSTQATAANRFKLYINNQLLTSSTTISLNNQWAMLQSGQLLNIGRHDAVGRYFDGYLAEFNLIDGQALTPSSFGETDTATGVWKPKKYGGSYGTNGFYLNFSDNTSATTLAYDKSGNGNNWTPNNISTTAGSTYDSMLDVPTLTSATAANYCVLNPLSKNASTSITNGNLAASGNVIYGHAQSTMFVSTGKWYFEAQLTTQQNDTAIGLGNINSNPFGQFTGGDTNSIGYLSDGRLFYNGSAVATYSSYTTTDIVACAFDCATGKIWVAKNNTWQNSGDPVAGTGQVQTVSWADFTALARTVGSGAIAFNFGQRPFSYTPPTGFKALNTFNLPDPTIKKPNQYMDATTYTGTGASQSIVNAGGFQPDFVWMKSRNNTYNHVLYDSSRGAFNTLYSNLTNAEGFRSPDTLSSFNSNGFSAGGSVDTNGSGTTYVGWQWKKGATPGFDIVTYTGTGANANISHSLGVAPKMIIVKSRSIVSPNYGWQVQHASLGATKSIVLNSTSAALTSTGFWNDTAPTSSVFTVGNDWDVNKSAATYVAYLFAEIPGFSKFGSYTGNGSADGPFVYCGFRPKYVMIKVASGATNDWCLYDTSRSQYNITNAVVAANSSQAESAFASGYNIDTVSNGFKVRDTTTAVNGSGNTLIYAAFAENPFKYSLAR